MDHGPNADLDGDGLADLVLRGDEKLLRIVPGSPAGPRIEGKVEIELPGTRWNFGMATTGDFNGDGHVDLAVGAPLTSTHVSHEGAVAIFTGAPGQLPRAPSMLLAIQGLGQNAELGAAVVAGDFDGDGRDDLLVSAPATSVKGSTGKVFLFRGTPSGLANEPALVLEHPAKAKDTAFGAGIANLGDVDGDGIDDVAIGAYRDDQRRGAVFVHRGSRGGLVAEPWITLRPPKGYPSFGYLVVRTGDVDGDGHGDLLVAGSWGGDPRAFLYLAASGRFAAEPSQVLFARGPSGSHLATAGDVNGDGHADLLVGDTTRGAYGGAALLLGGAKGYDEAHAVELPNLWHRGGREIHEAFFGHGVAAAGDVNGDGIDDVLAAAHGATLYWPGAKSFVAGEPVVVPGTTAGAPTFSE